MPADRATFSTPELASLLGVARGTIWSAARDEGHLLVSDVQVCPIRVGRSIRWPAAPIRSALGLAGDTHPGPDQDSDPDPSSARQAVPEDG